MPKVAWLNTMESKQIYFHKSLFYTGIVLVMFPFVVIKFLTKVTNGRMDLQLGVTVWVTVRGGTIGCTIGCGQRE